MTGYAAVCRECDWEKLTITREQAEHISGVHEDWMGHDTVIEEVEE